MIEYEERKKNTTRVRRFFEESISGYGLTGVFGVAPFRVVYDEMILSQKAKTVSLVEDQIDSLCKSGSIVSIGVPYKETDIEVIDCRAEGTIDYETWNEYALRYHDINQVLNKISRSIAEQFDGIPVIATIGGVIEDIEHVKDYFPLTISHRLIAEYAGLGWRGKNQLIIHPRYSCALRFASVILPMRLEYGSKMDSQCGECTACEDVCPFIRHRDKLPDYRENCRRYILHLKSKGIEKDVCGKCVKACYNSQFFEPEFILEP